jgi:hypothetical protein
MSEIFLLPYILDHGFLSQIEPVDGFIDVFSQEKPYSEKLKT